MRYSFFLNKFRFIPLVFILGVSAFSNVFGSAAQDTSGVVIPIYLQLWHDKISHEQEILDNRDSSTDRRIIIPGNESMGRSASEAIFQDIDQIRTSIETSAFDKRIKILYLNAINGLLQQFNRDIDDGQLSLEDSREIVSTFQKVLKADEAGQSIAPLIRDLPYAIAKLNVDQFAQNVGYRAAREFLLRSFSREHPEQLLTALNTDYSDLLQEKFVDTLIAHVAPSYPLNIYNYATSYTKLSTKIRENTDPLVKIIVRIGDSPKALRLLPFMDKILDGTYTVAQLEKISDNEDAFYDLSVKTLIEMNREKLTGKTQVGLVQMQNNVKARAMRYIRMVNELHEEHDNVRFAVANRLTPQEIYYVLVNGQEEIYTSSFVGLYKRMMDRMQPQKGDEFLMSLVFDHFRKFITLSAAYNTLDPFLKTLAPQHANLLMRRFVSGLENSEGLEDAVDVADAFASIKDKALLNDLRQQININFARMQSSGDERGKVIYGLLATLFKDKTEGGQATDWAEKMSRDLNLPPMDKISFKALTNSQGRIYQEVFFYGDKDGFASYRSFMAGFSSADWVIDQQKYWVQLTSRRGQPITIFAKKPMDNEDEEGMRSLQAYLTENNIQPTVFIHRGHSYHVDASIAQLKSSAKLVFLGSCGGYNSLASVLDIAPDAQIITSKQTGATSVNEPIIHSILRKMEVGSDLQWQNIWSQLDGMFRNSPRNYELFQDYIPPQENLGAVFIKAYKRVMDSKEALTDAGKQGV